MGFWLATSSWTETKFASWCSMHNSRKLQRIFQSVIFFWGIIIRQLSLGSCSDLFVFFFCQPPGIPMTGFLRMLGQRNKKKSESRSLQQQAGHLNPMEGILQGISWFAWNSDLIPLLIFYSSNCSSSPGKNTKEDNFSSMERAVSVACTLVALAWLQTNQYDMKRCHGSDMRG